MRVRERSGIGEDAAEFTVELPSDVQLIEETVGYLAERCRALAFRGPRLNLNFRVGVTEAISNAMLYGNRRNPEKRVRVETRIDARGVAVWVVDEGSGFSPSFLPDPTRPGNRERPYGRGIFLLRVLMDEVEYNEAGNAVRLFLQRANG